MIGTHQDLMEVSLADMRAFYREQYTPTISGCCWLDFEPVGAVSLRPAAVDGGRQTASTPNLNYCFS
jgi:hypothetical protein